MQQIILSILLITLGVSLRLLPHPVNVAPIVAIALFSGAYLGKKYALVIPLLAMMISDIFLGFHQGMFSVYGSYLLCGVIGMWLAKHKSIMTVIGASLVSSVVFFLVTNFNWWYVDALYPKTVAGLVTSYVNALPFFRNSVLGDLFYTGVFFGGYEMVMRLFENKKLALRRTQ